MSENKREKFLKVYADIPDRIRKDIIVIVNEKTYTWDAAYFEIKEKTKLGEKILKELEETKII